MGDFIFVGFGLLKSFWIVDIVSGLIQVYVR